jgi:[methyl-Co(III) methanol-specific corrinoid protein]:coenzyme M methyltransferase
MNDLSPKERLDRTIHKKSIDRPPVICPGGMMNCATVDVMDKSGASFPQAHSDADVMAALSFATHDSTGFENLGLPFCMTVEAEVLGSEINMGNASCEPKIAKEVFPSVSQVIYRDPKLMMREGRVPVLMNAAGELAKKYPDIPLIGSVTGPVSTAASVVDPMIFLKELRKDKENAHKFIDYVTDFLILYVQALIDSGASIISIADPTATGEILGPKMFEEYAVAFNNKLIDAIHATGTDVIMHICGRMEAVKTLLPAFRAEVISTDAIVNLAGLKQEYPDMTVMGNLSTFVLMDKDVNNIHEYTRRLISRNIDIIAPACGLSTLTPVDHIRAMTETVKTHAAS